MMRHFLHLQEAFSWKTSGSRLGGKIKALQGKTVNKSRLWSRKSLTNRDGTMRSRHGRLEGGGVRSAVLSQQWLKQPLTWETKAGGERRLRATEPFSVFSASVQTEFDLKVTRHQGTGTEPVPPIMLGESRAKVPHPHNIFEASHHFSETAEERFGVR